MFEGPRAFFISRRASAQAQLTGGRSTVPLDYSLSFDSNFAEKLRATLYGENIHHVDRARVLEVLMLKANNAGVQFDVMPFLYENIRLAREGASNQRPLNTLISFRMLDHLDWDVFRKDPNRFDFGDVVESLKVSLLPGEEAFLASAYTDPAVIHHEAKSLGIQALLLRFATLWHAAKPNPKRILGELIEFSLFELGFLPMTELSLIWIGITHRGVAPFFGPIVGQSKDMLSRIRGMAWDMTHLRLMEQAAQLSQMGSFFIPYFVSLDARWRDLMRLNPVRFMLVDDARKSMLFARSHEVNFQLAYNECASARVQAEFSPEKIAARRAAASNIDVEAMRRMVMHEERPWL
jgi:hypothetical protein